jgi:uncharacterized protein DUF5047
MLPGGTDARYRAILASAFKPNTRVEVWRSGERIDPYGEDGVPFSDGGLSATLQSQVTRQLNLTVGESLFPREPTDLLAPYGNELRVFQSVKGGAGTPYIWQTFRGRINECSLQDGGTVSVGCLDRAADVNDAGFQGPENSTVGNPITVEFQRIVKEGVIDATFGDLDSSSAVTPALTWEWDRGSACDDLATTAGCFWYALANGDYVMRFIPWSIDQQPLLTFSDGPGGSLVSAVPTLSREGVFNQVTVVAERADGTAPTFFAASDNNPESPTFIGGPFGVKAKLVTTQATITQSQTSELARVSLAQAKALTQTWAISMPTDPSIELGDVFTISARDLPPQVQVVSSFSFPLIAGVMSIQMRALQPGLVAN